MGLPSDDPPIGDPCPFCFTDSYTPSYIFMMFTGTDWDGTYIIPQLLDACTFVLDWEGPDQMSLRIVQNSNLIDVLKGYMPQWVSQEANCEPLHNTGDPARWAYWWGGTHPILQELLVEDNLLNMPETVYEPYMQSEGDWTFRVANPKAPANILIQYKP